MDIEATIASWIKQARTDAGLSGDALATRLTFELGEARGNTKANISHWETGKHSPSLLQLMAIVKVTNSSLPQAVLSKLSALGFGAPATKDNLIAKPLTLPPPGTQSSAVRKAPNPGMQFIGDEEYFLLDIYRCTDDAGKHDLLDFAEGLPRVAGPAVRIVAD